MTWLAPFRCLSSAVPESLCLGTRPQMASKLGTPDSQGLQSWGGGHYRLVGEKSVRPACSLACSRATQGGPRASTGGLLSRASTQGTQEVDSPCVTGCQEPHCVHTHAHTHTHAHGPAWAQILWRDKAGPQPSQRTSAGGSLHSHLNLFYFLFFLDREREKEKETSVTS